MNKIHLVIIGMLGGIVLSFLLCSVILNEQEDSFSRKREELLKELKQEKEVVNGLRKDLAVEREMFLMKIASSEKRYDSLQTLSRDREGEYRRRIEKLKLRTIKQLEHEADSIFRAVIGH